MGQSDSDKAGFGSYDRAVYRDHRGRRWHFASWHVTDPEVPYEERPLLLYFRSDDRKYYGLLKYEKRKDNPFRDYIQMLNKVMNDDAFRRSLLDPETKSIWLRSWK